MGARTIGTNDYRAKVKIAANGALTLYLVRVINNAETTLVSTNLGSEFNYTVGSTLQIKVEATGTSPTTVRAKVWKTSQTEPADWQLSTTDSTAALQAPGGVGIADLPDGVGDQRSGDLPVRRSAGGCQSASRLGRPIVIYRGR